MCATSVIYKKTVRSKQSPNAGLPDFLLQNAKIRKYTPNIHKMHLRPQKYQNAKNLAKYTQTFSVKSPKNVSKLAFFGSKIYHLATLAR
jgi:hypothetical protein